MGYSPTAPRKVMVHTADGREFVYRNATFVAHPDGDLVISDASTEITISVWARGQWQRATVPRS